MRAVLQRVLSASVDINGECVGEIKKGILLLLGIAAGDTENECDYLANKAVNLRIFEDENGKMNKSLCDILGEMLIISQFTLYADCKKGRRPSFVSAAQPELAVPMYERFIENVRVQGVKVQTGRFGADMLISLKNDGPVTIILDTNDIMPENSR